MDHARGAVAACPSCGGTGRAPLPGHQGATLQLLAAWEPATVATLAEHAQGSERALRDRLQQLERAGLARVGGTPQRWARTAAGRAVTPQR